MPTQDNINFSSVINQSKDKLSYLNMIQGIINRMAGNSAIMKGFAATIIIAMLGMVTSESVKWYYFLVALIPLIGFLMLDMFYLSMERKYRNLYALMADPSVHIRHNYTLSLKSSCFDDYQDKLNHNANIFKLFKSISIWGYYLWFVIVSIVLILITVF